MHAIADEDWKTFQQLLRDYRRGKLRPPTLPPPPRRQPQVAPGATVLLLDQLDNGGTAPAELLRYQPQGGVYDLQVVGFVTDLAGAFRLRFQGETTPPLSILASAAQLESELRRLKVLDEQLISVTIGNHAPLLPMRWRLLLQPPPLDRTGAALPWKFSVSESLLGSQAGVQLLPCAYIGSGERITVHGALPVGEPTPMRSGAQGVALRLAGGWGIVALEARRFIPGIEITDGYGYGS